MWPTICISIYRCLRNLSCLVPAKVEGCRVRVYLFEEDPSVLNLLVLYLTSQGHQVQSFSNGYECPMYLQEECECPASEPCADAVLVNARVPDQESIQILLDQDKRGCKLPKANKAVMSTSFNVEQQEYVEQQGFHVIKKPFRLKAISSWLSECSARLDV